MTSTRRPLDVAQELVAEPAPLGRALDQAGDVGEHEIVVLPAHHTEVRFQRGERVVGDLGLGRAHHRDQRRLARVGEADERGVGEQLQLELEPALLAVLTLLGEARRTARVRQEARVAAPALTTAGREPRVAVVQQVGEELAVHRTHDGSLGNVDGEIGAPLAVQLLTLAVGPRPGLAMRMVAEREQRGDVAVRAQPDRAAVPSVAAVGSALRHVRLAPERHTARAAVTTLDVALRGIDESRHTCPGYGRRSA